MQIDFVQKILKRTVEMMFESWKKMIFEIVSLPEYRLLVLHSFWLQQKNFNKILGQKFHVWCCCCCCCCSWIIFEKAFLTIFWQVYRTKNEKCHSCKSGHSSNSKFFSLFNDTKLSPSGLSNSTTISNFWKSIDVLSRINFTQKLPKTITWKLHNTSKQQDSFEHNF